MKQEHLDRGQPRLESEKLGKIADSPSRLAITRRRAEHHRLAARGSNETKQQLDRRRLSSSVWSEKPEHFTASDRHRQAAQRLSSSILLAEFDRVHGWRGRDRRLPFLDRGDGEDRVQALARRFSRSAERH